MVKKCGILKKTNNKAVNILSLMINLSLNLLFNHVEQSDDISRELSDTVRQLVGGHGVVV